MTAPVSVLGLPAPAWKADEVGMLYDMAHRFMSEEIAPRYDEFEKNEMVDRASWEKAGAAGLLCASMPEKYGGSGGSFAHESAIMSASTASASACTTPSSRLTSSITARKSRSRSGCRSSPPAS